MLTPRRALDLMYELRHKFSPPPEWTDAHLRATLEGELEEEIRDILSQIPAEDQEHPLWCVVRWVSTPRPEHRLAALAGALKILGGIVATWEKEGRAVRVPRLDDGPEGLSDPS